jgi:DNA helicase HerA-like ATPase
LKSIYSTREAQGQEITWLNPLDIAEELQTAWKNAESGQGKLTLFEDKLKKIFPEESLLESAKHTDQLNEILLLGNNPGTGEFAEAINQATVTQWYRQITTALQYVSDDVARSYFGKAREYETAGIFESRPDSDSGNYRINVLDIPSLPNKATRLLAVSNLVTNEWTRARISWQKALEVSREEDRRVPTFIVIDEAHNIIPAEPTNRAEFSIREQFRTIAAEGRKYGIFLILASQRPDKLDHLILSECENKAVMKLDSESILNLTRKELGLEDIPEKTTDKCLEFGLGRVLIAGKWAGGQPQIFYSAARRTIEGGRNLRPEYWALPG